MCHPSSLIRKNLVPHRIMYLSIAWELFEALPIELDTKTQRKKNSRPLVLIRSTKSQNHSNANKVVINTSWIMSENSIRDPNRSRLGEARIHELRYRHPQNLGYPRITLNVDPEAFEACDPRDKDSHLLVLTNSKRYSQ